jgi:carbon storage regulator
MLVLTRKPGQSIIIGDDIEIQVLSVAGEKVRIGISAPRDVSIFRHEVFERIEEEATSGRQAEGPRSSSSEDEVLNGRVEAALQRFARPEG